MEINIRPLEEKDAYVSAKWRNDKEIWKFTGSKPDRKITKKIERKWILEVLQRRNEKRFAICVGSGKKYIGNVQLTDITKKTAEYHIFIGDKKYWGKGIATNVTKKIIDYAFKELNLLQVYLHVNKENLAAIKAYTKCGFIKFRGRNKGEIKMIIKSQ